jgi:hypothetical protein
VQRLEQADGRSKKLVLAHLPVAYIVSGTQDHQYGVDGGSKKTEKAYGQKEFRNQETKILVSLLNVEGRKVNAEAKFIQPNGNLYKQQISASSPQSAAP